MRRKRTIIASRLGLFLNIIEIIGIFIATAIMTIIGLIFKDLVDELGDGSGLTVFFKIGGVSIVLALILIAGVIALIVAGRKIRHTAEYSANDYKNKNVLYTTYNVFSLIVALIITALAVTYFVSAPNVYSVITLIYGAICLICWLIITLLLNADMREAKKMVKSGAISNIDKSNYGQKSNVQEQLTALNNEQKANTELTNNSNNTTNNNSEQN